MFVAVITKDHHRPVLSQLNPVTLPFYFFSIRFNIIFSFKLTSSNWSPLRFSDPKLCMRFSSFWFALHALPSQSYLMVLITFGEEHKSCRSSSCNPLCLSLHHSWDQIAYTLETGRAGFDHWQRQKICSSSLCVKSSSEAHPASYPVDTGDLSWR
jgi:hypothetical protein